MDRLILSTPEETAFFGEQFASRVQMGSVIALRGELGAGKTTFVQGFLQGLKIQDTAQSPTFNYLNIYEGSCPIYHFDLYRLNSEKDFIHFGFEEFLSPNGMTLIEWPERISTLLPRGCWNISLSHSQEGRIVEVSQ
ncbi:MAG TPA: tRNA (adenosine(37)-N6)-threonylcarbamoyltransferase complex ATPase subunit type 1 TsaE [Chlamydiales bacterium]|jgi:tRNA threonylcarbamoyladenosine biosynthesis protein TsaE